MLRIMRFYLFLTIIPLVLVLGNGKKIFYEKDLSEYCKRRAFPSIFIGSHVVEASSYILHFTKLDLPYGCFISIRTESGCHMVMVISVPANARQGQACDGRTPQLLVYEMGETFGGYWGAIPLSLLRRKPQGHTYYTLKTTQPETEATEPSTEEEETTTPTKTTVDVSNEDEDFIRVEVPIVEVSGKLVPGKQQPTKTLDFDEEFDYQYDVTPIPGVKYETSILPLVQLSVRNQPGGRRHGQEPRYDLDIVEQYTPDARLTLPQTQSVTPLKQTFKTNSNRRVSLAKSRAQTKTLKKRLYKTPPGSRKTKITNKTTKYIFPTTIPSYAKHRLNHTRGSWEQTDKLMEKFKNLSDRNVNVKSEIKNISRIAENISNMKHNFSIYLAQNLSLYNDVKPSDLLSFSRKKTFKTATRRSKVSYARKLSAKADFTSKETNDTKFSSVQTRTSIWTHKPTTVTSTLSTGKITEDTLKVAIQSPISIISTSTTSNELNATQNSDSTVPTVSLVDHESWENIVQAAPGMAELLNQTVPHGALNKYWSSLNETYRQELLLRKKRGIQVIGIETNRPHSATTRAKTFSPTKESFQVADMQRFARLVELQDDDMPGRITLRFLKQYLGSPMYNICAETDKGHSQQVYLINSSRIVLSLNNFTIGSLSVILTAARTLMNGEALCPSNLLECQISGARVCVDSLTACDGVPNCGSYDIYDENRLMCGGAIEIQHNVYLAAFTFLVLLLTSLYAVHYWLKRCVPQVADAFFIYKDGVENILYLDSIMRAPGDDTNDSTKLFYNEDMFSSENVEFMQNELRDNRGLCSRLWRKCCICFLKEENAKTNEHEQEISNTYMKKTYSFTQLELSKIYNPTVDTSVQTGDSLDIAVFGDEEIRVTRQSKHGNETNIKKKRRPPILCNNSLIELDEPLPEDELSLIKFFRDSRSSSESVINKDISIDIDAVMSGETEISNVVYDRTQPGSSGLRKKIKNKPKIPTKQRKRIRFDNNPTTIPSHEFSDEENEEVPESRAGPLRPVLSLAQSWKGQHLNTIKEDDGKVESGRHRYFWEGKGKKSKKKTNTLR